MEWKKVGKSALEFVPLYHTALHIYDVKRGVGTVRENPAAHIGAGAALDGIYLIGELGVGGLLYLASEKLM